ncbi:MAG: glutamine hydrolyzing CTP synthase [Nanoarchaeota archaeon]
MTISKKKYIIVTGGVISGLGKGVASASIGLLLSDNYRIVPIKMDGYLNVDPGTMNPIEHGEVFVLDDGGEVDMDFGHYERFMNANPTKAQSITMGKIYDEIREKERRGDYLGKTVQLIPHVTDLIQEKVLEIGEKQDGDIVMVEIGGTIGDIENDLFVEAMRQLKSKVGRENICYVHLTYVPIPYGVKEQKTKPTQQSVDLLRKKGVFPDFILARCSERLAESSKKKIALFADLPEENVLSAPDVSSVYKIPSSFEEQKFLERICEKLNLSLPTKQRFKIWEKLLETPKDKTVFITIAGKYTDLEDSYASIIESLKHCEYNLGVKIEINWIETSSAINYSILEESDGIIVPGGFGTRGVEGKIEVIRFARENKIPYLGICYGMQLAIIEFARHVCGIDNATSMEVEKNAEQPVITLLDEQQKVVNMGGTMRLGAYTAKLTDGQIKDLYAKFSLFEEDKEGNFCVSERHRHRFEVNPNFTKDIEKKGLNIVGRSYERNLVEFIELPKEKHPYFVGTQAHPELKSKLEKPAPLFYGLIKAAIKKSKK